MGKATNNDLEEEGEGQGNREVGMRKKEEKQNRARTNAEERQGNRIHQGRTPTGVHAEFEKQQRIIESNK